MVYGEYLYIYFLLSKYFEIIYYKDEVNLLIYFL